MSSSAGYASKRTAAPESTPRETVGGVDQCGWRTGAPESSCATSAPKPISPHHATSVQREHLHGVRSGHSAAPCDRIRRDHASEAAMTPTPRAAFITVVATLAYLWLAILVWGSFATFFSHPPLIAAGIGGFVVAGFRLHLCG